MTLVTLFTDASYCHRKKVGGWAMWAKRGPAEKAVYGGRLKGRPVSSAYAEIAALANAMARLETLGWLDDRTLVIAQTDCLDVINYVTRPLLSASKNMARPRDSILERRARLGFRLDLRHVKAHIRPSDRASRHHVNETVDQIAKHHMRAARAAAAQASRKSTTTHNPRQGRKHP